MSRPAVRESPGRIRAFVIAALDAGVAVTRPAAARGSGWVRRGRWAIAETTDSGVLVACEVTGDARGLAFYVGPAAVLRSIVPRAVREAWLAEQYGESDDDPPDAPGPVAPAPRDREPATPSARAR